MSFKLFFASTFGLIKSTAKIEAEHEALYKDYQMFRDFEKSAELKEFHELDLLVKSATFLQQKKEIQRQTFKGSKEEAQLNEVKKLEGSSHLKKFYLTLNSEDLKRFEKISASEKVASYKKLKSIVKSPSFDAAKKKDEKSEEYAKFNEYHNLKASEDILFYEQFAKSPEYKNYLQMKDSPECHRFEELRRITESAEFKARLTFLDDKHKWEKTDESVKENRLAELKKMPELQNYLKYHSSKSLDFYKKWNLVFEDHFELGKLDAEKWTTISYAANQTLGQNYSQPGDLHAVTDGKNITVGKSLNIEVRKERAKGMQWKLPFGFVEQEFDYTSGLVSTAGTEWWKHGILEAKVKYQPDHNLVDALYLIGEENSPQINLVEMGVKNRVGMFTRAKEGIQMESANISGLKSGEFYIFRLEWTSHSLIWKINNREILNLTQHIPAFKMHLNAASIVVSEPTGNLPHRFEIDWVRFYQHHHPEK
jgi:hypothetical protein